MFEQIAGFEEEKGGLIQLRVREHLFRWHTGRDVFKTDMVCVWEK